MQQSYCIIMSKDMVFKEVIHRLINSNIEEISFLRYRSLPDIKKLIDDSCLDIIFLDDTIDGANYDETISQLRREMGYRGLIYFFSQADYITNQATKVGVDFAFKKPFDPVHILNHLLSELKTSD